MTSGGSNAVDVAMSVVLMTCVTFGITLVVYLLLTQNLQVVQEQSYTVDDGSYPLPSVAVCTHVKRTNASGGSIGGGVGAMELRAQLQQVHPKCARSGVADGADDDEGTHIFNI